jgi:hypothetical protein
MAINRKLQAFSKIPRINQFSKLLDKIETDIKELSIPDFSVEILQEEKKGSALKRFLSFQMTDYREPDQIMVVSGRALSKSFTIVIPLRTGGTLPYFVEIDLDTTPGQKIEFKKAFVGGKWKIEEKNKGKIEQLKKLKLPDINWTHARADLKFKIMTAHQIIPNSENLSKSKWIIHSGYQGFLFGVGPKAAKYIKYAQEVENFLNIWR